MHEEGPAVELRRGPLQQEGGREGGRGGGGGGGRRREQCGLGLVEEADEAVQGPLADSVEKAEVEGRREGTREGGEEEGGGHLVRDGVPSIVLRQKHQDQA